MKVGKPHSSGKPHIRDYIWTVQTGIHMFKGNKAGGYRRGSRSTMNWG